MKEGISEQADIAVEAFSDTIDKSLEEFDRAIEEAEAKSDSAKTTADKERAKQNWKGLRKQRMRPKKPVQNC